MLGSLKGSPNVGILVFVLLFVGLAVGGTGFLSGWTTARMEIAAQPQTTDTSSENGRTQRELQDLAAQNTMAIWTMVVAIAGVISLGITTVGVIAVWRTLQETRKAVEATSAGTKAMQDASAASERIGKAQTRSYLSPSDATYRTGLGLILIELELLNTGQSPALDVKTESTGHILWNGGPIVDVGNSTKFANLKRLDVSANTDSHVHIAAGTTGTSRVILMPRPPKLDNSGGLENRLHRLQLTCTCSWMDVHDGEHTIQFNVGRSGALRLPERGSLEYGSVVSMTIQNS